IVVKNALGIEAARVDYPPPAVTGQSITRSPDVTGGFAGHLTASGSSGRLFSPGTRIDGSTFTAPVPFIATISPESAVVSAGETEVALFGSAFQPASQVVVDGEVLITSFSASTLLTAVIPASVINQPGAHALTVRNALTISNAVTFTVLAAVGINELL